MIMMIMNVTIIIIITIATIMIVTITVSDIFIVNINKAWKVASARKILDTWLMINNNNKLL